MHILQLVSEEVQREAQSWRSCFVLFGELFYCLHVLYCLGNWIVEYTVAAACIF